MLKAKKKIKRNMYPWIQMMALGSRNKCNFLSKTPSFLSSLWIQVEGMSKAKQVDLASEGIAAAAFQKHGVECFTNPPQQMTNAFLLFLFVSFLLNLELDSGGSVCRCGVWLCVLRFKVGCDRVREGWEGCGWLAFEDEDGERGMWLAVVL